MANAILKGYRVRVMYSDGSVGTHNFDYGDEAELAEYLSGLNMDGVDAYSVQKVWSKPGEPVSVKVKHNGG